MPHCKFWPARKVIQKGNFSNAIKEGHSNALALSNSSGNVCLVKPTAQVQNITKGPPVQAAHVSFEG